MCIRDRVLTVQHPIEEKYHIHDLLVTESGVHMEVVAHSAPGEVRCVALESTYGLSCGMQVTNTGSGIQVPVGEKVLGRVVDVLGNPIDGDVYKRQGYVCCADRWCERHNRGNGAEKEKRR